MSTRSSLQSYLDILATSLLIITCIALLWSRYSSKSTPGEVGRGRDAAPTGNVPLSPIPLSGAELKGSRTAAVAVVEFSEFRCPFCARFARETFPMIEQEYISRGQVLWAFRHLPITALHPDAMEIAAAAACAGMQEKFWPAHDVFFQLERALRVETLEATLVGAGVQLHAYSSCMKNQQGLAKVGRDMEIATDLDVSGTPTFMVGIVQSDGTLKVTERLAGSRPFSSFKQALDLALAKTR